MNQREALELIANDSGRDWNERLAAWADIDALDADAAAAAEADAAVVLE